MKKIYFLLLLVIIGCSDNREQSIEFNKKGLEYSKNWGLQLFQGNSVKNIEDSVLYFFGEAIRIDSTNKIFYANKFAFENLFHRFDDAKKTAELYYRSFKDPQGLVWLGGTYLKLGDTIQSKSYFNQASLIYKEGLRSEKLVEDSILSELIFVNLYIGDTLKSKEYYYRYRDTKKGRQFRERGYDDFIRLSTSGARVELDSPPKIQAPTTD